MKKLDLRRYFDRTVLINLKRRPDRLARVHVAMEECHWPFQKPKLFYAVDGLIHVPPKGFRSGASTWGCLCSHRQVLGRAIRDGIDSLLILEDDVCFVKDFRQQVEQFLLEVPDDWDGLMLGGQHATPKRKPLLVKPGVLRCTDCVRLHCYAVRGKYLRKLYQRFCGGGKYNATDHADYIMSYDPELLPAHKVYAPEHFIAGQERGRSDNFGLIFPRQFWNAPGPKLSVINLHAPQPLAAVMREHGWYTGLDPHPKNNIETTLLKVFENTKNQPKEREYLLHEWIKRTQWTVGHDPDFVCTVWHPDATPKLVKAASLWPVYEVTANTVKEALRQVPRHLRRAVLPVFS